MSAVVTPASAKAMAAVSPAGPPPTIATSTVNGFAMIFSARVGSRTRLLTCFGGQDEGPETMIRAAISACIGNALSFCRDRFCP